MSVQSKIVGAFCMDNCNIKWIKLEIRKHAETFSNEYMKAICFPWYVMYREGSDSDLIAAISLTRASFDLLLSRFKLFYKFHSGGSKGGRPSRVRDHHCVLSLLLHTYCSTAESKTWSEMFGIAPSTLRRTLLEAELPLLKTPNSSPSARVEWPSVEDQIRIVTGRGKGTISKREMGFY